MDDNEIHVRSQLSILMAAIVTSPFQWEEFIQIIQSVCNNSSFITDLSESLDLLRARLSIDNAKTVEDFYYSGKWMANNSKSKWGRLAGNLLLLEIEASGLEPNGEG